jgi:hypothetical protein
MESSQKLISMSFRKLNTGKSQKTGIDLRKNLLVFTVISACRSQKKILRISASRKRPASLEISEADSSKRSKQALASFENAFLKSNSSQESLDLQDNTIGHSLESDDDDSDNSLPTQVPHSFGSSCYISCSEEPVSSLCISTSNTRCFDVTSSVQSTSDFVISTIANDGSSADINIILDENYLSVANTYLSSSERPMNEVSEKSDAFGSAPQCLPVAAY